MQLDYRHRRRGQDLPSSRSSIPHEGLSFLSSTSVSGAQYENSYELDDKFHVRRSRNCLDGRWIGSFAFQVP